MMRVLWKEISAALCYISVAAGILFTQLPIVSASPSKALTEADVQCVIIGARMSDSPSPDMKLSGGMLMIYFLGRLDGRTPTVNIEKLIRQELGAMTSRDLSEASGRCRAEFSERGKELVNIGHALSGTER